MGISTSSKVQFSRVKVANEEIGAITSYDENDFEIFQFTNSTLMLREKEWKETNSNECVSPLRKCSRNKTKGHLK